MAAARRGRAVRAAGRLLRRLLQSAREHGVLLRAVRTAVRVVARGEVDPRAAVAVPGGRGGAGGGVRGDRLRRVRPQAAVPQPEGGGGRPVRKLLPGELALFRPQHLRALPRAGDDRGDDGGAVERAPPRGAGRRRGAAVAAGRSGDELLAVEHRGPAARPGGACGPPLGLARHDLRDGRAGGDRAGRGGGGAAEPAPRVDRQRRLGEQRHQRAHEAGRRGTAPVRRPSPAGLRAGLVRAGVPRPRTRHQHQRDLGLAHDPDHRRGRAGGRGPGAVRGAAGRGLRGPFSRGRPFSAETEPGDTPPLASARGVLRGAGAAHLHLRRLPRGPGDVGAAGDRHGARHARLPEAPAHQRRGLPGGRHRGEGPGGDPAAAVHAPRAHAGLRRLPVAADRGDPVEHLPARGAGGGVRAFLLHRRGCRAPRADRAHGDRDGCMDDDGRGTGRTGLLGGSVS